MTTIGSGIGIFGVVSFVSAPILCLISALVMSRSGKELPGAPLMWVAGTHGHGLEGSDALLGSPPDGRMLDALLRVSGRW